MASSPSPFSRRFFTFSRQRRRRRRRGGLALPLQKKGANNPQKKAVVCARPNVVTSHHGAQEGRRDKRRGVRQCGVARRNEPRGPCSSC